MISKFKLLMCIPLSLGIMISLTQFVSASTKMDRSKILFNINVNKTIKQDNQISSLLNVGCEFAFLNELMPKINSLNLERLRLINVDVGNTNIINGKIVAPNLDYQLTYCKAINAEPHIIIGQAIPPWLSNYGDDTKYGPSDWSDYQEYIRLFFEHVFIEKGLVQATFEVANEPDIGGAPVLNYPHDGFGSENDYMAYLELYRHIEEVAVRFIKDHPDIKLSLGGPACTIYTYVYANFNWHKRFLRDTANMKLDFFSFHYYGNSSTIGNRPYFSEFPPFEEIAKKIRKWVKQYRPGLPIMITEYGASWGTSNLDIDTVGITNATNVGAAWMAAFISTMVQQKIENAIYLVISDFPGQWGWPALFHDTTPKPPFFIFEMFKRLQGKILRVTGGSKAVGSLATYTEGKLKILCWNFNWQRHGGAYDIGDEFSKDEVLTINISGLPSSIQSYLLKKTEVSECYGNPYNNVIGGYSSSNPLVSELTNQEIQKGVIKIKMDMPPSSVILLEITDEQHAD